MHLSKFAIAAIAASVVFLSVTKVLHAQSKVPAYLVIEIDVKDAELYKQYLEKGGPLYAQFKGRFLARGGKVESFAGEPPKRAVIAVFESLQDAQAFRDSASYRELIALRDKASTFRAYIAEGLAN